MCLSWLHATVLYWRQVSLFSRLLRLCACYSEGVRYCKNLYFYNVHTIRLNRLRWSGHVQRMEENRIPKRVLYMNLGTTRLRGRPRNRWQDEVREDGRTVGGEGWQEKVHNGEEWKKLLRTARNRHILHMPMEWMNELHQHLNSNLWHWI